VLSQSQPEANHNGGQLQFGPDGFLYIGFGDGGGAGDMHGPIGNAQNLNTLLGKILRINPLPRNGKPYQIPASNPFVGRAGARGEIYSYGLRNPWRFSFDRQTGDLSVGDVGQSEVEEIDFVAAGRGRGANFGWRPFEGNRRFTPGDAPGHVRPVLEKFQDQGYRSIIGGYVIRDPALRSLRGRYIYGDFVKPGLRTARLTPSSAQGDRSLGVTVPNLSSFGEDARGRIYATSLDGPVYRLQAK
jgi:hypothetical protein